MASHASQYGSTLQVHTLYRKDVYFRNRSVSLSKRSGANVCTPVAAAVTCVANAITCSGVECSAAAQDRQKEQCCVMEGDVLSG
jgi:hypothetical protein